MLQAINRFNISTTPHIAVSLEDLYHQKTILIYHKGKSIPLLDHDIYFVHEGIVQLSSFNAEGDSILLGLATALMPFGLPFTSAEAYHATALSNISLVRFTMSEVEQYFNLTRLILRGLDMRLQQSEAIQSVLCSHSVKEKLYRFFVLLCREIGEPVDRGTRLKVRFTHEHLANAIGATRVSVTRILKQFRQDGILLLDERGHFVMNLSKKAKTAQRARNV
jgi:CRP-like cAMP-binding protein